MPKENTHAYFAQRVLSKLEKEHHQIANKIKSQKNFYILGGYSPDVFFYSKKPEYKKISDYIHGHGGEKTNMIPRELAEKTKVSRKTESEAFLYGFLTHLAMDIVFHPVIFYLTGNPYSKNKEQNPINFHRHRQLETALDKNLHRGFGLLDPRDINIQELLFIRLIEDKFNADKEELLQTYRKHFSNNLLFRRKYLYYLILFLNKINILKISDLLGLFYQNAKKAHFPKQIGYKDLLTGEAKEAKLEDLLDKAEDLAIDYITTSYKFLNGQVARKKMGEVIQGQNLDTGVIGKTAKEINYTKFD